ncbi:MAG: hypothetical protein V4609_13360 [Pseudomonadota bacterium]
MSTPEVIAIDTLHKVRLTRTERAIRLEVLIGGMPVFKRELSPSIARQLGDALGFMSNDLQFTAPGGTRQPS